MSWEPAGEDRAPRAALRRGVGQARRRSARGCRARRGGARDDHRGGRRPPALRRGARRDAHRRWLAAPRTATAGSPRTWPGSLSPLASMRCSRLCLDRLEAPQRAVLQRGSVEGQVFTGGAVEALSPESVRAGVEVLLSELVLRALIEPAAEELSNGNAFRFHHLLLRDVAYDSLDKRGASATRMLASPTGSTSRRARGRASTTRSSATTSSRPSDTRPSFARVPRAADWRNEQPSGSAERDSGLTRAGTGRRQRAS